MGSDLAGQLVFATASGWVTDTSSSKVWGGVWHDGVQENLETKISLEVGNFWARYVNGNIKRGIINIHVNIRSLYNKISEVKNLVKQDKPHILAISEAELRKSHHNLSSLKVPGYDLILPKSWEAHGKARVVVYIKKSLGYEHLPELEHSDIQTVWIKAGFKNTKKIYFSHQYREHTSTLGGSMAAQRGALEKMLAQWEDAIVHGTQTYLLKYM